MVHCDWKPENILYAWPEPDETIKLCDFGLAKALDPGALMTAVCGTPGYIAPEVLNHVSPTKTKPSLQLHYFRRSLMALSEHFD